MNETSTTLRALAAYQRGKAEFGFVTRRIQLTPAQLEERAAEVRQIADEVDALADEAEVREIQHREFDNLLGRFRAVGKPAPSHLMTAVNRAISAALVRRIVGAPTPRRGG